MLRSRKDLKAPPLYPVQRSTSAGTSTSSSSSFSSSSLRTRPSLFAIPKKEQPKRPTISWFSFLGIVCCIGFLIWFQKQKQFEQSSSSSSSSSTSPQLQHLQQQQQSAQQQSVVQPSLQTTKKLIPDGTSSSTQQQSQRPVRTTTTTTTTKGQTFKGEPNPELPTIATTQKTSSISNHQNRQQDQQQQQQKSNKFSGISNKRPPQFKKASLFQDAPAKQVVKKDKKGNVLHNSITSIKKDDLIGLVDATDAIQLDNTNNITYEEAIQGREPIMDILQDAGVTDIDVETILQLPTWNAVTKLYGGNDGPVIVGLDTCQDFQNSIPLDDASIGTAGMFNTGTNPFAMYLEANCIMPHNIHDKHGGMRWQVPWGKHTLANRKWTNTAGHDFKVNKTNVLPVILVRDPYSWMQSMCKHPYAAKWLHDKHHCPGLVPTDEDRASFPELEHEPTIPVTVKFNGGDATFKSLAHFWTEWYTQYIQADYPRLIVRFEDLQFHAKEMIDLICQCAGAVPKQQDGSFTYIVDSGKWGSGHKGKQTNMISAMIKYGTDKKRFETMTKEDMSFASHALDPALMELFQYEIPSMEKN